MDSLSFPTLWADRRWGQEHPQWGEDTGSSRLEGRVFTKICPAEAAMVRKFWAQACQQSLWSVPAGPWLSSSGQSLWLGCCTFQSLHQLLTLICSVFAEDVVVHTSRDAHLQDLWDAFVWFWCGANAGFKDSVGGGMRSPLLFQSLEVPIKGWC